MDEHTTEGTDTPDLPLSPTPAIPSKRKRSSKSSSHPAAIAADQGVTAMKPKRKRTKLGRPVGSGVPAVDPGAGQTSLFTNVALRQPTLDFGINKGSVVEDDARDENGDARSEPHEIPSEHDDDGDNDDEEDMTGRVPLPQPDRSKFSDLLSTTPLPPPPTLPSGSSTKQTKEPTSTHSASTLTSPASFAQMRKNIMRNLMFKGDPKVPFANSNLPPVASRAGTPDKVSSTGVSGGHHASGQGRRRGGSMDVERVRADSARSKGERMGSDTVSVREDHERDRSGSPMDIGADDDGEPGIGVEGERHLGSSLRRNQHQAHSLSGWEEGRIVPSAAYADWTPTQSEADPLELTDQGVPEPPAGQYQQTLRPEPPRKRGQGKKKLLAQAQELALKAGQEGAGSVGGVGSMTPERGGMEHEGTPGEGPDGVPVKKKRRMQKPAEEGASGTGTWRKGLKKGQTRADAIAMFREKNPGMPLPPGWDFPTITPHPPAARMTSFKKEPPVKVVIEPKGDIVSYITVAQVIAVPSADNEEEEEEGEQVKAEVVRPAGPPRPMAVALKIDVSKVDETDFEKLGVEIGPPLNQPDALATRESLGHPILSRPTDMQGLPCLKVIDPSKIQKERDALCPRELKENLAGQPRRFRQKEMSITTIGGAKLNFKSWTSADVGPSTWQLHRDARVAEQQKAVEEAMMNDPTMTGGEGTPVAGTEGYYDDNGQFVLGSAATSGKGKRNGLTKTGKPRKQWTKKGDKPDPNKRIADSLKRMEGSPMIGTPELGTATVNSEVGSSPAPMPDLDDAAVSQADYSRPPSPNPGLSVAGDDVDAEMEDLL